MSQVTPEGKLVPSPKGGGVMLSRLTTEFDCPVCTKHHDEDFYYNRLVNSQKGFIYKKCSGCKTVLGIALGYTSVHVWIQDEEE